MLQRRCPGCNSGLGEGTPKCEGTSRILHTAKWLKFKGELVVDESQGLSHRWEYRYKGKPQCLSCYWLQNGLPIHPSHESKERPTEDLEYMMDLMVLCFEVRTERERRLLSGYETMIRRSLVEQKLILDNGTCFEFDMGEERESVEEMEKSRDKNGTRDLGKERGENRHRGRDRDDVREHGRHIGDTKGRDEARSRDKDVTRDHDGARSQTREKYKSAKKDSDTYKEDKIDIQKAKPKVQFSTETKMRRKRGVEIDIKKRTKGGIERNKKHNTEMKKHLEV
eukprot:Gb_34795 [translate_table: standard]